MQQQNVDGNANMPEGALDLSHRAYPELASALRGSIAPILQQWRSLSLREMSHLNGWTQEQFENDVRVVLESVAVALDSADSQQIRSLIETAPRHGFERFLNEGSLLDLLMEQRILRGVTVVRVEAQLGRAMKTDEAASLHATVDVMIQQGVLAMVQNQKRQLREAEDARRSLAVQSELRLRDGETRLAAELEDARVLQKISNELVSEGGPNGHYHHIVEAARALMCSEASSIQELDAADSRLKLLTHTGFHPESADFWQIVDADVGSSCGRALTAHKRVVVPDMDQFEAAPRDVAAYRKSGIMSVQSTPLVASSGRIVGMMSTHWNHPHTPSAESYRFFDILARLAADFMERTRTEAALRASEERQAFLLKLSDALRPLDAAAEIQGEATRLLREHLAAGWCCYVEWDEAAARGVVLRDATRDGLPSLAGTHDVSDVPAFLDMLRTGNVLNVADYARFDALSPELRARYAARGLRSMLVATLVKQGRLVASLLVGDTEVRSWSSDMEELLTEVAERTWAAVERAKAEAALRINERRVRIQSEAFQSAMNGEPLARSLRTLAGIVHAELGGGVRTAFYMAYPDGLRLYAIDGAGDMPATYTTAMDGFPVGPDSLCSGKAIATGRPALTRDVRVDPQWQPYLGLASAHGFRAAGSYPILTAEGRPVGGSLALYFPDVHEATPQDAAVADAVTRAAAIILSRHTEAAERARAETALRASEERFRTLSDTAPALIWRYDAAGENRFINRNYLEYTGVTAEQITDDGWQSLVHPDDAPAYVADYLAAVRDRRAWRGRCRVRRHDGAWRWFEHYARPLLDVGGEYLGHVGVSVDVQDAVAAEAALRASEEKYKTLFGSMDEAYAVVEVMRDERTGRWSDFVFLEVNPAFVKHTGTEYPVGKTGTQLLGAPNPRWAEVYGQVAETGVPIRLEEREPTLDRVFDLFIFRLDGPGTRRVAVLFTNITDRKQTEALLAAERDAMNQLRELSDRLLSAADLPTAMREVLDTAIALHGADYGTVQTHDPSVDGLRYAAVRGFDAATLAAMPPIKRDFHSTCAAAFRTGQPVLAADIAADPQFAAHCATAASLDYRAAYSFPLTTRRGNFLGVLTLHFRDRREPTDRDLRLAGLYAPTAAQLIERHQADEALRQSQERLHLALVAAQMGTWTWRPQEDQHHRDANLNRLLGLEPVDATSPIEQFFSHIHPGDRERTRAAFDDLDRHGRNLNVDFRVVWPDGQVRWLSDQGDAFGNGDDRYLAGACVDITDRKRLEQELVEADRRKDEFLAMLAHELRNPMAPIRTATEVLKRSGAGDGEARPAIELIERQVVHMVRLVDDLLDVSRVSRGKIELMRKPVDLVSVIQPAVEIAQPQCDSQNHDLSVTLPSKPLYVNGDATRLTQVVGNLLNNACKFTERDGRIWLSVERERDRAVIRVRDNGIGIAADQLAKIFEVFAQIDTSRGRSRGGLGLGLALVKNLVEMHEGTIDVHSAGVGQGSEFVIRLPLISASQPPAPTKADTVTKTGEAKQGHKAQRRVLVVDDNRDVATALAMLVKLGGHEVHTVHDGLAAVDAADKFHPDIILLDLGLPGIDGYEVARRIRAQRHESPVKLVALSGWAREEDRRLSREAGFDAHMVKPPDVDALNKLLDESAGV